MRKSFIAALRDDPAAAASDLPRSASGGGFGVPSFKGAYLFPVGVMQHGGRHEGSESTLCANSPREDTTTTELGTATPPAQQLTHLPSRQRSRFPRRPRPCRRAPARRLSPARPSSARASRTPRTPSTTLPARTQLTPTLTHPPPRRPRRPPNSPRLQRRPSRTTTTRRKAAEAASSTSTSRRRHRRRSPCTARSRSTRLSARASVCPA
mgnify:CR=1 FL=1